MPIDLSIVTPAKVLVEEPVDTVIAPGAEGEFGVLTLHEPLLAPLQAGELRYEVGGRSESVAITGGFAEVTQDHITILAEVAGD